MHLVPGYLIARLALMFLLFHCLMCYEQRKDWLIYEKWQSCCWPVHAGGWNLRLVQWVTMSPTLAAVLMVSLLIVDQSTSSTLVARNDQRQMNAPDKQSGDGIQRRSIRGTCQQENNSTYGWVNGANILKLASAVLVVFILFAFIFTAWSVA